MTTTAKIWTNVIGHGVRTVKANGIYVGVITRGTDGGWSWIGADASYPTFRAAGEALAAEQLGWS